jgi:Tol biopolymer transport system component
MLGYAARITTVGKPALVDRKGSVLSTIEPEGVFTDLRISPDGGHVLLSRQDPRGTAPDIWLQDLARSTLSRVTYHPMLDASALWHPNGRDVYFRSNRAGLIELYRQPAEGSQEPETVFGAAAQRAAFASHTNGYVNAIPGDITPDGKVMIYNVTVGPGAFDLWLLPLNGGKTYPFIQTPFNEIHASISGDGKWVAYASDDTGRYEVYVQRFDRTGPRFQISNRGGWEPRWRRDGREIYYLSPERQLMAVELGLGNDMRPGPPAALFGTRVAQAANVYRRNYDVSPDGRQFVINVLSDGTAPPAITIVLNWHAGMQAQR